MSFARLREDDGLNRGGPIEVNHATAMIVGASLLFLILVRRGFRGFSVPGVGSINVAA